MREIQYSSKFKRDFKLAKKQNKDLNKLRVIVDLIVNDQPIPEKYADHQLKGEWSIFRELHIEPDWLLIYRLFDNIVRFERIGSHSELFG